MHLTRISKVQQNSKKIFQERFEPISDRFDESGANLPVKIKIE
jgi:hypothetical protein